MREGFSLRGQIPSSPIGGRRRRRAPSLLFTALPPHPSSAPPHVVLSTAAAASSSTLAAGAAMLHLQKYLLSLQRALISTAAAASSSSRHFAAEDYLVAACGLTREKAAKAAKYISHWKSPSKGNAVLEFLTGPELGLSKADVAFLVGRDPRILNCSVDNNRRARVDGFRSNGFSAAQISDFVRRAPYPFRTFNVDEKLGFWMSFLGSDKLLRVAGRNLYIGTADLDKVKTNIRLLEECGLSAQQIRGILIFDTQSAQHSPFRGNLVSFSIFFPFFNSDVRELTKLPLLLSPISDRRGESDVDTTYLFFSFFAECSTCPYAIPPTVPPPPLPELQKAAAASTESATAAAVVEVEATAAAT